MRNVICVLRGAVLFVGKLPDLAFHSTVTSAAVVGLDSDIRKRIKGDALWKSARSFVFDGILNHETILSGNVGILFADPGSEIGIILSEEAGPEHLSENPSWAPKLISTCVEILNSRPEQYSEILNRSFPFHRSTSDRNFFEDDRLVLILRRLIEYPEETVNVEELSDEIGMSSSWLQHEFKNAVGLPLRAFRKWYRVKSAVIAHKQGASLADAALSAGFYDQSHFTNAFREIFGISPSSVFGKGDSIDWYFENEQLEKILAKL
ncbi:AraC family transcriptional regulator [Leptospira barantonii]|uniref:AraC family transcriptional regulator n=1 Tax=Leptospira barantonii TaxID=2023184 RepID=A0A5F2B4Q0_9LEPT|nr:AraC family transcriptional regulator [Leptospira barantonii]TGM00512.1 AraC family transcriptional regulator [Leptospira barantonii]